MPPEPGNHWLWGKQNSAPQSATSVIWKGALEAKTNLSLSVSRQMPQNLQKQLVRECWMEISSISLPIWITENPGIFKSLFIYYCFVVFCLVTFGLSSLFPVWRHLKKCALLWMYFLLFQEIFMAEKFIATICTWFRGPLINKDHPIVHLFDMWKYL